MLIKVMEEGRRLEPSPSLGDIRDYAAASLASLPEACRRLRDPRPLQPVVSKTLRDLAVAADEAVEA